MTTSSVWPRRLVAVCANPSVDKITAVDHVVPGEVHRPDVLSVVPGGKGLNMGRAAARLGMPVHAIAMLRGHAGDWMAEALAAEGIATRVVRADGETRTCLSVLDRATGALTEFYEPGQAVDAAGWAAFEAALRAELADDPPGALVVLSGSLPPGAPDDGYARLLAIAADAGARAVVDSDGRALAEALVAKPWLVKLNAREAVAAADLAGSVGSLAGSAQALAGSAPGAGARVSSDYVAERTVVEAAGAIRRRTGGIVLVTRGAEGAVLLDDAGVVWRIGGPPELGRYPVGSGDSLLGGFVHALSIGSSLVEAARFGGAVGAANALVPGQGTFDRSDVERMLAGISAERIA